MPEEDKVPLPPSEPHSDFPLPGNWAQAWPIILWGMLALALVFVFAESLGEIVVNPAYRAGSAVVALITVTSMVIYRKRLLEKFRNPSGGLIVAVISVVFLVLALSPLVEQKRWPLSAWFAGPTPQKLQDLQSRLAHAGKALSDVRQQGAVALAKLQFQITAAQQERDHIKQQLVDARSQLDASRQETNALKNAAQQKDEDELQHISPNLTVNLISRLGLSEDVKTIPKTFVILTAKPDNAVLGRQIDDILDQARGISAAKSALLPIGLPDYGKDLDAPKLDGRSERGITIHGRNDAGNILMQAFTNCFITHQTGDTPTAILEYWKRIYPQTTKDIANITWIDIGSG